jgi:hypothetical protein
VVDTIGQHVKGATHILAKENKVAIGTVGNDTSKFFYKRGFYK